MKSGVATIITVLVLSALITLIGLMLTNSIISESQSILMDTKSQNNLNLLDACAEESLYQINIANTLPSTIITPLGNCAVTLNSQIGSSWNYSVATSGEMSPQGINIIVGRGSSLSVSNWQDQ